MTINEMKQVFGLDEKTLNDIEATLLKQYGENFCQKPIKDFFSHIQEEKISMDILFNLMNVKSLYFLDCNIAIYMMVGYYRAKHVKLSEKAMRFYDGFDVKCEDSGRKKDLLKYFPYDYHDKGIYIYSKNWCFELQNLLLCSENYEIFDVDKKGKDITRYGAVKNRALIEAIKSTEIENRVMLDFELGISLTNCIYKHVCWINKQNILKKADNIIKLISRMPCMNIRNLIALEVFDIMKNCRFADETINVIEKELKEIIPIIEKVYWFLVKLKWIYLVKNEEKLEKFIRETREEITDWINENTESLDEIILECKGKMPIKELTFYEKVCMLENLYNHNRELYEGYSLKEIEVKNMSEYVEKQVEHMKEQNQSCLKEKEEIKNPERELSYNNIYAVVHRKIMQEILHKFFA